MLDQAPSIDTLRDEPVVPSSITTSVTIATQKPGPSWGTCEPKATLMMKRGAGSSSSQPQKRKFYTLKTGVKYSMKKMYGYQLGHVLSICFVYTI